MVSLHNNRAYGCLCITNEDRFEFVNLNHLDTGLAPGTCTQIDVHHIEQYKNILLRPQNPECQHNIAKFKFFM